MYLKPILNECFEIYSEKELKQNLIMKLPEWNLSSQIYVPQTELLKHLGSPYISGNQRRLRFHFPKIFIINSLQRGIRMI